MKEKMKREMKRGENFFGKMFENAQIRQMNEPKRFEKIPFGRITPPFFFESSESDRVFNYLHDSNSIDFSGYFSAAQYCRSRRQVILGICICITNRSNTGSEARSLKVLRPSSRSEDRLRCHAKQKKPEGPEMDL